jgi:hypothetical protein
MIGKRTEWTTISRHLARRTTTFEWHSTYATDVALVVRIVLLTGASVPAPLSYSVPMLNFHLHERSTERKTRRWQDQYLWICTRSGLTGHVSTWAIDLIVLGEDINRIFPVMIEATKSVAILKDEIKKKKKPEFDHVPADSLILWKVSSLHSCGTPR